MITRTDFERGVLRVGEIGLTPDTRAAELEKCFNESPGLFVSKGQTSASVFYTLGRSISFAGIAMTVRCRFCHGRLDRVTLSPEAGDDGSSHRFLEALIGAAAKEYPWGRVEACRFADYHDDYHGGDVYITYYP